MCELYLNMLKVKLRIETIWVLYVLQIYFPFILGLDFVYGSLAAFVEYRKIKYSCEDIS